MESKWKMKEEKGRKLRRGLCLIKFYCADKWRSFACDPELLSERAADQNVALITCLFTCSTDSYSIREAQGPPMQAETR